MDGNNAAKIFNEDIKEKKVIANSARSKASKSKKIPAEKEVGNKHGNVIVTSIYDDIMNFDTFSKLSRSERKKALEAYLKKYSYKIIAETWGKKVQAVHDLKYRLYKLCSIPPTNKVEGTSKKEPIKTKDIYPVVITLVKELSGEQVQSYIMKVIDLLDSDRMVQICLDLQRFGEKVSKFNISMKIEDTVKCSDLSEEILNGVGMLPQTGIFQLTLAIKEIK